MRGAKHTKMQSEAVETWIRDLGPGEKDLVERSRGLIRSASNELLEGFKWNAPSYSLNGTDIITFNNRNHGSLSLIFHTGPKGKDTQTGQHPFQAPPGLIEWLADKRLVLRITGATMLEDRSEEILVLLRQWIDLARRGFNPKP